MDIIRKTVLGFVFTILLLTVFTAPVYAAKLFLSPSSGVFTIGSTFNVNIFLNTEEKSVNTVSAILYFPADKLQLVSPTIGQSVINVWTANPIFNNQTGTIKITGGIPGGINVQSGLVSSLTFRVKQVDSSALVKFSDESRVLANDGKGTDILTSAQNGVYNLILPPPQGPSVSSETHPDQAKWYSNKNIILRWANINPVESYSYVLNQDPADFPDNIPDSNKTTVAYKDLTDGTHYFHIKALRNNVWGGVTSFGINIDTAPPAEFSPEFIPSNRTSSKNQIINFQTSDVFSGISYYEIKVIPLNPKAPVLKNDNFFVEAESPYQLSLDDGKYDIILRAYDKAGNYRELTSRLNVVAPILAAISGQGIKIIGSFIVPWFWFWLMLAILFILLLFAAFRVKKWHNNLNARQRSKELPQSVKSQLELLKNYRKKYGNLVLLIMVAASLFFGSRANAQQAQQVQLSVPFVSSVSRNISNEEIFYIGGKTDNPGITVIIYLQNLQTGETFNENVVSDSKGNWFYRHPTFLSPGQYLLWTQSKLGEELSPPSPQIQMAVQQTAIQFGASRFSYETIYLIIAAAFLIVILGLIIFIMYHAYYGRKKHKLFWKEVMEAEESIRRGFAVLKRDIEAELAMVRKANLRSSISKEAKQREAQLLEDFDAIQKNISKEVWDIEQTEHLN